MLWSILLVSLLGCEAPTTPSSVEPPETVILVIGCTLRADRMSMYGNPRDTTPYLNQLAAEGVVFEHLYANAPWTRPSVATLASGRYALATGIPPATSSNDPNKPAQNDRGLHPDFTTIAEAFSAAGWTTVGATANPNANAHFGMHQGFDVYHEATGLWREDRRNVPGDVLVDAWLERAAEVDGPLFGQVLLIDTHFPLPKLSGAPPEPPLAEPNALVDEYDVALQAFDRAVARLERGLQAQGRSDRLLVLVGDHGEGLNLPKQAGPTHGRFIYDAITHVPWILHGDEVGQGLRVDGLAEGVDLFPTLAELKGVPTPEGLDGDSRAAEARGERSATQESAVFTETRYGSSHRVRVSTPKWSFIYTAPTVASDEPTAMLFARDDVLLEHDLADQHPDEVADLERQVTRWASSLRAEQKVWIGGERSEDINEQLRALGYIE